MLIASAAMFFAVAGSAFILRARMAAECCPRAHTPPPPVTEAPIVDVDLVEPDRSYDCGRAIYSNNPDGTVTVTFPLCDSTLDRTRRVTPDHIEVILVEE